MSFNLNYLYEHLPSRFRREDKNTFLKRFLIFLGETLDGWDETYDTFHESVQPATAAARWVGFWLMQFFGWSWFPWWFTLADKRRVYGNFARHLGRRGTRRGIELFLRDFGIVARVHLRPVTWGEFVWGETSFSIAQPLHFIIEILSIETPNMDACFWDEGVWGESFYTVPRKPVTEKEIIELVKFQQPHAQVINVYWKLGGYQPVDYEPVWGQFGWNQLYWAEEPEW